MTTGRPDWAITADAMPEHYPKGTQECTAYCNVCKRDTQHRVDFPVEGKGGGRRGPCLEHEAQEMTKAQIAREEKRAKEARSPRLFE